MLWAQDEPEAPVTKIERLRRWRGMFDLGQDFVHGLFNREETQVLGGRGLHTRAGAGARLAVPRKLGFRHEATLRHRGLTSDGRLRDTMIWTLLADEYPTSPAAAGDIEAFDAMGDRLL